MRRFAMLSALLALAACGGEEDEPPLFGGFTPTGGGAVLVPSGSCTLTLTGYPVPVTVRLSAVAVGLTDYADVCDVVAATQAYVCGDKASSTIVFGVGVRMNVFDWPIADAGAGTYSVTEPQPDASGYAELAIAVANQSDASCLSRSGSPLDATKGRITVATLGETVTGDVDLTFEGGSRFGASFDVPLCPASFDFCAALNGTVPCEGPYPTPCVP